MEKILTIIQIAVSILLTVAILLQNRGAGLGSTFGGDFGGYYTKRGFEKFLFSATIFLGAIFLGVAVALIYITSRAV
ncbi:MAG: preprotein translocase subunit SecG [Parcubacteria group bacterium]|jgi:protein translocase SecG subunit